MNRGRSAVGAQAVAIGIAQQCNRAAPAWGSGSGAKGDSSQAADGTHDFKPSTAAGAVARRNRAQREQVVGGGQGEPALEHGRFVGQAADKIQASAWSSHGHDVTINGKAPTNAESASQVRTFNPEDNRRVTHAEGTRLARDDVADDDDLAAINLGIAFVGVGTPQSQSLSTPLDDARAIRSTDDTIGR